MKNEKLDYIKVKYIFIKAEKEISSYKLKLLKNIKVYYVFYILLLKLANPNILIQNIFHY